MKRIFLFARERTCACVERLKERRYFFLRSKGRHEAARRGELTRSSRAQLRGCFEQLIRFIAATREPAWRRRVYEGHEPRLLQDLLLLFVSARAEKKLGKREGRDEMERSLRKVRLKHTPCLFFPFFLFSFSFPRFQR